MLHSLRDLSSLTRDQTQAPAVKAPNPNHWTTREFPSTDFLIATIKARRQYNNNIKMLRENNCAMILYTAIQLFNNKTQLKTLEDKYNTTNKVQLKEFLDGLLEGTRYKKEP